MPSRIVPAQTSRSGPVRASVALRGLAGAAHACGNILQNPLQHSLKLRHSHRAVAAGLLWPGKIRYFASQNRARSTRRPSSSTGSARLQTCSVERDASRRRGRHNKNSDNGRERPQSQRLERLRPEPAPPPVRTVAKTHKTATDASLTEKLEISARLSQLLNEDVFVATELEKEPEVQQRRGSRSSMEKFRQMTGSKPNPDRRESAFAGALRRGSRRVSSKTDGSHRSSTTSTGSDRRGSGDRRHRADSRASDRRGSG